MALLLIDDDESGRRVSAFNLKRLGYEVDEASDGERGLRSFDAARHDVVITDLKMPGVDGFTVVATLRERAPEVPVVVITAFGNVEVAVRAMRAGAWDFIEKPFTRDQLELTVARAVEASGLRRDNRRLRASAVERPIVASSVAMTQVLALADRVAATRSTVLITGESGVGKELVARRIHARSPRSDRPFVAVNCGAIPETLLESELFGHTVGAFSGAIKAREGRFRHASGGTIFLDEIGEMPIELQSRLLRVLQEGLVDVVGQDKPVPVDVRVIAATNQDLEERIASGAFRSDLFYRLNVIAVHVPALRDRPSDLRPLAEAFVRELSDGRDLSIPEEVHAALEARAWPGNVRELRNACERLTLLCPGTEVRVEDLPPPVGASVVSSPTWLDAIPAELSLVDVERQVIAHALRRTDWNVSATARALGVPRHVLAYRIEKYGLQQDG